jgi:urease accessory protein
MTAPEDELQALKGEIATLKERLADAKNKLNTSNESLRLNGSMIAATVLKQPQSLSASSLHTLLLLSDSALPLGSFAFSSGLESFLAHNKLKANVGNGITQSPQVLFNTFLGLSLQSLASTALPYVLAAYREPQRLHDLDNDFDASTPCTVARRASIAQGRALLSVWERSFRGHYHTAGDTGQIDDSFGNDDSVPNKAQLTLQSFSSSLRSPADILPANAHLAPLWGIITLLLGINLHSSAYLFLFSHARTVISAAVRASVVGPYQAQAMLASGNLQYQIEALVGKYWERDTGDAGQSVPVVDLWVGRHEKLYSRIFNS